MVSPERRLGPVASKLRDSFRCYMEVAFVTQNSSLPILLASDFPILRDSLKSHFEQVSGITVVGCASNEGEVMSLLQSLEPKLVVLDLNVEWVALCALLDRIHAAS